ncbi:hypothetical protein AC579_1747 [Pseudocercospora musae]|uniref:Uncharacterized protein n=1 Tax=Pseudocercospora musae TaxID=113226 RepID=A0A139H0K5_9PEZI|nr:hypothetical protein AC579_1747 [Pseudocercospora musae]
MARATRKRAAAERVEEVVLVREEAEEMEADNNGAGEEEKNDNDNESDAEAEAGARNGLRLAGPINWKAGRPIPVNTLLPRLQALAEQFQSIDQGSVAPEVLQPKAAELVNTQLLDHNDYGIKVYTLICIVELFRIMAPNAPFKQSQLVKIFDLIVKSVIPALADPGHSYNGEHATIVSSLANIKSIILLCDLPGSDTRIKELFTHAFDVMAGNAPGGDRELLSKNVEFNFTSMLCAVVEECQSLPTEVTDVILAQFLRADPNATTTKKGDQVLSDVLREVSPAYSMARSICNTCEETMIRQIGSYFNSVLIDASSVSGPSKPSKSRGKKRTHDESEDEDEDDSSVLLQPSDEDLQEVAKAHRLLRELWRACPAVIQNVIPQIEAETAVENVPLRVLAVRSIGDMIAGIGAAGPPPPIPLAPDAYPSQSLESYATPAPSNILLVPAAPQAFSNAYPSAYQAFFDRHRDKSAQVRAAWVTEAGRIVLTSAGGKGLDSDQETRILRCFADMLLDQDEKVRSSGVQALIQFDFHSIVSKLGRAGGVKKEGSVLSNLVKNCVVDQRQTVSIAATELAGRIWGVASGAIMEGNEKVRELLGGIPSEIFRGKYKNKPYLNQLIDQVVAESLLPLGFPPIKSKKEAKSDSQRVSDSQSTPERGPSPDKVRVARILALVRDLDDEGERHAKVVFLSSLQRQVQLAKYVKAAVESSEKIGANSKTKDAKAEAQTLQKLVKVLASAFAEPEVAANELTRFFEHYERRNYALIRFCIDPSTDYKKVVNAIRELKTRLAGSPSNIAECSDTVMHLLQISSVLVYNRSHVPAIVEFSRTDEAGLGSTAHDILKDISTKAPSIFEVHVTELCKTLMDHPPSATSSNSASAADTLKACAGFARQFPQKMPKDRKFYQAMSSYAKYGGSAIVVKHAITVIVAAADKKEMYAKDILQHSLKDFTVEDDRYLTKLAALTQLSLLAYKQLEDQQDAIQTVLAEVLKSRTPAEDTDPLWSDELDEDAQAKLLALKTITNRVRGQVLASDGGEETEQVQRSAEQVFNILNSIVKKDGELAGKSRPTPAHYRSRLRLDAAKLILKLCCNKTIDSVFLPIDLVGLTKVVQDPLPEVRAGFCATLKKYLGQGKLNHRFYALMFLYAFEPIKNTKEAAFTYLRARALNFAKNNSPVMESVFAHFLSLLAHHEDFTPAAEDIPDFIDYLLFFLKAVASEQNLGTLYAITRRVKQVEDAITPEKREYTWTIADLSEGVIRIYEQIKGWTLLAPAARPNLPKYIYQPLVDRTLAEEVAHKNFLPDLIAEDLESLVKSRLKSKKRKAVDGDIKKAAKRARPSTADDKALPVRKAAKKEKKAKAAKTPKRRLSDEVPTSERRKSNRVSNAKSYAIDSGSDEDEVEKWDADDSSEEDEEANKENVSSTSTPPTSDPLHPQSATNGTKERTPNPTLKATLRSSTRPAAKIKTVKEKAPPQKKAAATKKEMPTRIGRSTRNARKEKDTMDMPSDSDGRLSDALDEMEV